MDDPVLINEVLELTLAHEQGDATEEERARLERLFTDNPQAIAWYLRVVEDTLALRDAAIRSSADAGTEEEGVRDQSPPPASSGRRITVPRLAALSGLATAACLLIAVTGAWWWSAEYGSAASGDRAQNELSAQVVSISNVRWSDDSVRFDEWSLVKPGDVLRFESGLVSLFLANGAELRIEGPADLELVSQHKVMAYQGKFAARVGPRAIGFCIETPHANVIDRGTSFGLSVDKNCRTAVVVYEGMVDLDVLGDHTQPRRRLATGEALSVDRNGHLSRITTVQSADFLEPAQVPISGNSQDSVIDTVSDNVQSLETAKYYRIVPRGFREDCRAYVDRLHEWNGLDERGLPPFLAGGDYVMMFNDDKIATELEIAVVIGRPANLYVLIDDRVPPPDWLKRDFVDTRWDIGSDDGWDVKDGIVTGFGAGQSIDHVCSVWRREVKEPTTVEFGALSTERPAEGLDVEWSMYGIVATPLAVKSGSEFQVKR
jgi:ferric-dicitrate binding protein FerR (iron transport regulator)